VDILSAWIAEPGKTPTNREELSISGTSMGMLMLHLTEMSGTATNHYSLLASPHVAGVAASILSDTKQTAITNAQDVIGAILINAEKGGIGNLPHPVRISTTAAITKV
jgi:subtilisin family serine protease